MKVGDGEPDPRELAEQHMIVLVGAKVPGSIMVIREARPEIPQPRVCAVRGQIDPDQAGDLRRWRLTWRLNLDRRADQRSKSGGGLLKSA